MDHKMLLKHSIVKITQRNYFCKACECSISSLICCDQHLKGACHRKCISSLLKYSTDEQQNSNSNTTNNTGNKTRIFVSKNSKSMQRKLQDLTCVLCQCTLPSLEHFRDHLAEKKHKLAIVPNKWFIKGGVFQENMQSESKEQNMNINVIDNQNASVSAFNGNDPSILSDFKTKKEEQTSLQSCNKDINDSVLQLKHFIDMAFCCLCDTFIHKATVNSHIRNMIHKSIVSKLHISNYQVPCIVTIEQGKETIRAIQKTVKKFNGTTFFEYTEAATYTCDHCNKMIKDDIIDHENTVHKNEMVSTMKYIHNWSKFVTKNFNIAVCYPLFKCSFCNEIIHGMLSLLTHFSTYRHERNMTFFIDIKKREYDSCKIVQDYFELFEFIHLIFFEKSDKSVRVQEQPVIYVKIHHKTFCSSPNVFARQKQLTYICFACPSESNKISDVITHLNNPVHLEHLQNIFCTYNYIETKSLISEEEILMDNLTESLKSLSINDNKLHQNEQNTKFYISHDIYKDLNIEAEQFNSVSSLLQNEYVERKWKTEKYTIKFLDFEKILFTCNKRKLNEMKLHLNFFFPSNKMYCLLCDCNVQLCKAQAIYEHINCYTHVMRFEMLQNTSKEKETMEKEGEKQEKEKMEEEQKEKENMKKLKLLQELIIPFNFHKAECFACNTIMIDRSANEDYKYHTSLHSHKNKRKQLLNKAMCILEEFQDLWYKIKYFACIECGTKYKRKILFLAHLNEVHHAISDTECHSGFDFCLTCATLWFSKGNNIRTNYQLHCQLSTHKYLDKSNDFTLMSLPKSMKKILKNFEQTIDHLFTLSNDTSNDPKVTQLTNDLKNVFKTYQLPVEIYTFGSRVTGLALPNSDVDVFLNFDDTCSKFSITSVSRQIKDCLSADHKNWNIESVLTSCRTPIIKVKHRLTGLQCDISFTNSLSVENSKLIRSFNKACQPCKKLILFLKRWLSLGGLNGSHEITNYALVWLVIFYLQVKFQAPSIGSLINNHNQSKIISGWETGVGDTILINLSEPIYELLLGFFEYYGNFNYMRFVVCPLLGETCEKKAFLEISSSLPTSMAPYIAQLKNKDPEYFRVDSPMCVQDPFDLSHNITKAVSILTLKRFKYYCNESLLILSNIKPT